MSDAELAAAIDRVRALHRPVTIGHVETGGFFYFRGKCPVCEDKESATACAACGLRWVLSARHECAECTGSLDGRHPVMWPCPTLKALDADE